MPNFAELAKGLTFLRGEPTVLLEPRTARGISERDREAMYSSRTSLPKLQVAIYIDH